MKIVQPQCRHSGLKKRYMFERLFKLLGFSCIGFAIFMLILLISSISMKGYKAFYTHYVEIDITWSPKILFDGGLQGDFADADYHQLLATSFDKVINKLGFDASMMDSVNMISSSEIANLKNQLIANKKLLGTTQKVSLLVSSDVDMFLKHYIHADSFEEQQAKLITALEEQKIIVKKANYGFFTNSDSRYPELAGIKGAFVGSILTIILTIIFAVILSVGASVYLEEFAPNNRFIRLIEVNINNLAAIPSIVFGLLGLIVFQQFFGVPRASPVLASFVLTLMALPIMIISTRIALSSVPNSIKEAAYGVGSSKLQMIIHHMLPVSMPGILTGIIISISRIMGETAPLLMIGMVAFINSVPTKITSSGIVFPVQILLWSDSPEVGYIEKASAAIMLLLMFLMFINWLSIYLRNKFEVNF